MKFVKHSHYYKQIHKREIDSAQFGSDALKDFMYYFKKLFDKRFSYKGKNHAYREGMM